MKNECTLVQKEGQIQHVRRLRKHVHRRTFELLNVVNYYDQRSKMLLRTVRPEMEIMKT